MLLTLQTNQPSQTRPAFSVYSSRLFFLPPATLFPRFTARLPPSRHSGFSSSATCSETPSRSGQVTLPFVIYLPLRSILFFLARTLSETILFLSLHAYCLSLSFGIFINPTDRDALCFTISAFPISRMVPAHSRQGCWYSSLVGFCIVWILFALRICFWFLGWVFGNYRLAIIQSRWDYL